VACQERKQRCLKNDLQDGSGNPVDQRQRESDGHPPDDKVS
jgi:hypothetical protein